MSGGNDPEITSPALIAAAQDHPHAGVLHGPEMRAHSPQPYPGSGDAV